MSAGRGRFCSECGSPLPAAATFCRGCGARGDGEVEAAAASPDPVAARPEAAPAPAPKGPSRRRWRALALAALGLAVVGAGVATALLLIGGDDRSDPTTASVSTDAATVPDAPEETTTTTGTSTTPAAATAAPPAVSSIAAGVYVQAGSFRTAAGAEAERLRLDAAGIRVSVVSSDQAEDLYPGFQVLLGGPFAGAPERRSMVDRLHRNGVPSAFARTLSPGEAILGPEDAAGSWSGTLELSGFARPNQNGQLRVTLSVDPDGRQGNLEIPKLNCSVGLSLLAASDLSLSYSQDRNCLGAGDVVMRPEGGAVAMTLLPPNSDAIVVGRLAGS